MPASGKVLEDSIRLARIRHIKMTLYAVQAVMMFALAFLVIFVMGGAQITPVFYLPVDSFAAVMVLLLLVICLESFFFRIMEVRFARSSSARHLMAKNSIKFAIVITIISGIVAVTLIAPPVLSALTNAGEKTVALTAGADLTFWSRDPLAFQRVSEARATATASVEIYLVLESVFEEYGSSLSQMYFLRINKDSYIVPEDEELVIEVPAADLKEFRLVLNDIDNPGTIATVTLSKSISEAFTGIVSLMTLALVVANIAWIAYLTPIERKYSVGSIYR
jgi:hypothetical protein